MAKNITLYKNKQKVTLSKEMIFFLIVLFILIVLRVSKYFLSAYTRFFIDIIFLFGLISLYIAIIILLRKTFDFRDKTLKAVFGFFVACFILTTCAIVYTKLDNLRDVKNVFYHEYSICEGRISEKAIHTKKAYNHITFSVNGIDFVADYEFFYTVLNADNLRITYLPQSKYIIDIQVVH